MSTSGFSDDVYQPDPDGQEGERFPDMEDALDEPDADDLMDTGYSPPDFQPQGTRPHDTLDARLAEEEPERWDEEESVDENGEVDDGEVGQSRAGRLVAPDEGAHEDRESEVWATDVGIDGGAASAEEAAMHVIPE